MACFPWNSATLLDAPTESRKTCASKALFFLSLMPDCGSFLDTVLVAIQFLPSKEGQTSIVPQGRTSKRAKLCEKERSHFLTSHQKIPEPSESGLPSFGLSCHHGS